MSGLNELEVIGGDGRLTFRRRYAKDTISARVVGPREIVGIPGSWVDAVFKLDGNLDLFEDIVAHLEKNEIVDRVVVRLVTPNTKVKRKLEDLGFVHLGLNVFTKPVSRSLAKYL